MTRPEIYCSFGVNVISEIIQSMNVDENIDCKLHVFKKDQTNKKKIKKNLRHFFLPFKITKNDPKLYCLIMNICPQAKFIYLLVKPYKPSFYRHLKKKLLSTCFLFFLNSRTQRKLPSQGTNHS